MTGDDHNTDALIAALRSPALPAERIGEAAAVTAMLGVLARAPASTRFRAGRGIAIAVVTVASLGVGGLAAAGPGVFQAAASKARSLITANSVDDTEGNAGAVTGDDPLRGSLPDGVVGDPGSFAALGAAAALQAATTGDVTCADGSHGQTVSSVAVGTTPVAPAAQSGCGQSNNGAGPASGPATPPECTDGNHGDAVAPVANASVPPSAEQDHSTAVNDVSHENCTPEGPQGNAVQGSNPNKPTDPQGGAGPTNTNGNPEPGTSNNGNPTPGTGNTGNGNGAPPATTPANGNGNANGSGNGNGGVESGTGTGQGDSVGTNNGQGGGPGVDNGNGQSNAPTVSVPANNGKAAENGKGNGG